MKYYEVTFRISPYSEIASDILSALLADVGFETFQPLSDGVQAWVQQLLYSAEGIDRSIGEFPLPDTTITYTVAEAPDENWNRQWEEEGFRPILIPDAITGETLIVVHDTSHSDIPQARYDIRINPCQAFGTGSHETTRMIMHQLLDMPIQGRHVIDAGTGTGILSILCCMLGANRVLAYDIDEWSVRNALVNLDLNGVSGHVQVLLGDSAVLSSSAVTPSASATLLIANINRNILLADMPAFASALADGGELLLSGFYIQDVPLLVDEASRYGFSTVLQREDNDWALLLLKKGKSS